MVIKHDEFLKCNTGFFYGELEYIIIELQDANKYDRIERSMAELALPCSIMQRPDRYLK